MKWHRLGGAVGFVVLLGACEVHVGSDPGSVQPSSSPPAAGHAVAHAGGNATPAPPPPHPTVAPPAQPAGPHAAGATTAAQTTGGGNAPLQVFVRPGRIVHPPPSDNVSSARLDVQQLKLRLRPERHCGPHESTPGHWISTDCHEHTAIASARKFSGRKLKIMMRGGLKLDTPLILRPHFHTDASEPWTSERNAKDGDDVSLPDESDHRKDGTEGPIKDQGQVGSCTSFSLSSAMDNAIRRQNKTDTMSSIHIWSHYGYPNMAQAGDGNTNKPIATWEQWPYDERVACMLDTEPPAEADCGPYNPAGKPGTAQNDATVQAKIKDSDSKGHWKISEYDEISADPSTIAQLLATGADVWASMKIGSTWMNPKGDTIADWNDVEGGHAIDIAGYRTKDGKRQFLIHNSWGKEWGDGGFAFVSEAALAKNIKHAYKVVVVDSSAPPPPANDPNALTDDDCGEDQLVDSVTGQCADICSDDSRPANGQCAGEAASKKPQHK